MRRTSFGLGKEMVIFEYERGILYRDGKKERLLEPGRYRYWWYERVEIHKVSLRQMSQVLPGQEILTSDRIEVRVSLIVQYRVLDPEKAMLSVENYIEQLYQELQLALREVIARRSLEEVLDKRAEMASELMDIARETVQAYGVELNRVGTRDIVLPREVRTMMMQEIQADREGRADLVRARHEVAAARARANTAKILAENPEVSRLQELDALINLAGKQGNVVLLPNLADWFVPRRNGEQSAS